MVRKPQYLIVGGGFLLLILIFLLLKTDNFGKDIELNEEDQVYEEGFSNDEITNETGVIEDPALVIDPLLEQKKTNQEIIDTRLNYYKQSKKELGIE